MKTQITIDLPDGWEPDGEPKINVMSESPSQLLGFVLPVRLVWQWPEWLTAEWIVRQWNGCWVGTNDEPVELTESWLFKSRTIDLEFTTFVPPPCTDWRTSKRRNPRSKQP